MKDFIALLLVVIQNMTPLFAEDTAIKPKPKNIPVTTAQPEENKVYPIAVIGAGAGGTMATRRAVLYNREVLLFTGTKKELKNSRGNWVRKVDTIPGLERYTRTVVELRNETLETLVIGPFADKLFVIKESVVKMEKEGDHFLLTDSAGKSHRVRYVIMATGMMDTQPHIQGSIEPILKFANKQHINYCLLCDGHRSFGKQTVVIGHEEDAGKGALILWDRYQPASVTIMTNGAEPAFSQETTAVLKERNIRVVTEPIQSILANDETKQLYGFALETEEVPAEIGFVLLGVRPNNSLAQMIGAELDARGLVVTDKDGETNVENLFVIGDLRANSMKQIYTAWQHAVDAVQVIDRRIRAED